MYEVSIFYVLGGLVMFPSTTFLLTRYYYTKLIHKLEREKWVLENTVNYVDTTELINELETRQLNFREKQMILKDFFENKPEYNEVINKSNLIHEITTTFRNE
tara:strand:+ start:1822 stop:2130 length:309 start_codon:yes stop_codon:yes gene_type:complete